MEFWIEFDTFSELLSFQKKEIKQGGSGKIAITSG